MRIKIPAQTLELAPSGPDRWSGSMTIDGVDYRVEAYKAEPEDDVADELIDDLYRLAECGGPLRRHTMPDGTEVYLVVMPRA